MRTDLFDFELPAASIALRPASPRDSARMLVVQPDGVLRDRIVADLPQWLEPGDQLVVNDTKVIAAQLRGRRIGRATEPKIEATLIKRIDGSRWQALVKPAKKLSEGDVVRFGNEGRVCLLGHLDAQVEHKGDDGEITLSFSFHGPTLDQAIADLGAPPLPPYIASQARARRARSQPTTRPCSRPMRARSPRRPRDCISPRRWKRRCAQRGVGIHRITLHVGPGPSCRSRRTTPPRTRCMPSGAASPPRPRARSMRRGPAAGASSPSAPPRCGCWKAPPREDGTIEPFTGETAIFITPGYRFRAVDILMTNFHLPRSTLFMLVSAFSGLDAMKTAYAHAIERGLPVLFLWRRLPAVSVISPARCSTRQSF